MVRPPAVRTLTHAAAPAEPYSRAADTVVILVGPDPLILEKPLNKEDQLKMLESYQDAVVEVATGVTVGACRPAFAASTEPAA